MGLFGRRPDGAYYALVWSHDDVHIMRCLVCKSELFPCRTREGAEENVKAHIRNKHPEVSL